MLMGGSRATQMTLYLSVFNPDLEMFNSLGFFLF